MYTIRPIYILYIKIRILNNNNKSINKIVWAKIAMLMQSLAYVIV